MVIVRFDDQQTERRALEWLAGRFSFKTWANGDLMIHKAALPYLAREGISFKVKGPAKYEHSIATVRNPDTASIQ